MKPAASRGVFFKANVLTDTACDHLNTLRRLQLRARSTADQRHNSYEASTLGNRSRQRPPPRRSPNPEELQVVVADGP